MINTGFDTFCSRNEPIMSFAAARSLDLQCAKRCMYDHTVEQIVHTRNKRLNLRRALTCLDPIQFRQLTPVRNDAVSGTGSE